ncbi:hypothetical protein Dimus_038573 [Dionaea muscipula]
MFICIYVDDLLLMGSKKSLIDDFKHGLVQRFEMTDLGLMSHYLEIKVQQKSTGVFISQSHYIVQVLEAVSMSKCKPVTTPMAANSSFSRTGDRVSTPTTVDVAVYRSVVRSLRYITCTRPDIAYAVGIISKHMQQPKLGHWLACKRVLRYLKGTLEYGMWFPTSVTAGSLAPAHDHFHIVGYSDNDWAGDVNERKSTTGFVFMSGSTAIFWASKKQPIVALSSSEAKYVAAASCVSHALWLRKLMTELGLKQEEPIIIHVDNQSAIVIANNPVNHDRSKHIDVRFHFLREAIAQKDVELKFVRTHAQVADVLTKALSFPAFSRCRKMIGVMSNQA